MNRQAAILDRHMAPVLRRSRLMRRVVLRYARQAQRNPMQAAIAIQAELQKVEPQLGEAYRISQLATWLDAAKEIAKQLPDRSEPPRNPPPFVALNDFAGAPHDPPARLVQSVAAANYLRTRLDFTPAEFKQLDADAQRIGFTVARATTTEAVSRIRRALAQDIEQGGTLTEFYEVMDQAVGPVLSDSQVEAIYRTQVGRAYSAGQQAILDHPAVQDEFPYLLYSATHDARTRPDHLAMEELGLDGTAVYRADDPIWQRYYPPWGWNCRCVVIPLSVADAASYGVREAQRWLRTGTPPSNPQYVRVTFDLPRGWVPTGRRLSSVV